VRQLEVVGEDYQDWFGSHDGCFLLTHQPPDWLCGEALEQLNSEILTSERFIAHLYGHMHEEALRSVTEAGAGPRRSWQGRSLFGLETYIMEGSKHLARSHGYCAGRLDVEGNDASVRLWPREAIRTQAGPWQ